MKRTFVHLITHTVRPSMTNMGYHYDGATQMQFATPGKYELFIKRDGKRFDVPTGRVPNGRSRRPISTENARRRALMGRGPVRKPQAAFAFPAMRKAEG